MIAWATVAVKKTNARGMGRATMNWLPRIPVTNPTKLFASPPMPMMLRAVATPAPMAIMDIPVEASASCASPARAPATSPATGPPVSEM